MFPKKASDSQDLNYQILYKTPKRDIYYSEEQIYLVCQLIIYVLLKC